MKKYLFPSLLLISFLFTNCKDNDCAGVDEGTAYIDDCGECVEGTTGLQRCYVYDDNLSVSDTFDLDENDFENTIQAFNNYWWFGSNVTNGDNSILAARGKKYLLFEGTSEKSVYITGASFGAWGANPIKLTSENNAPTNPDDVYFNVYVYGTGDKESELYITMFENDHGNAKNTDDGIQLKLTVAHYGWKLISRRYSDIPFKTLNATTGNNTREPHKIVVLDFALQSKTIGEYAKVIIDYPCITVGGPLKHQSN